MRVMMISGGTTHDPLRYPTCMEGHIFQELSLEEITEQAPAESIALIEYTAHHKTYHIFYRNEPHSGINVHQMSMPAGVHEIYHFQHRTLQELEDRFRSMEEILQTAQTVHLYIETLPLGPCKITVRDPLSLANIIARRIYRFKHFKIEATWRHDTSEVRVYSIAGTSQIMLLKQNYHHINGWHAGRGVQDSPAGILANTKEATNVETLQGVQFYSFNTEAFHTNAAQLVSNNSLLTAELRSIVRLDNRRVYSSDIEVPDTECWYLVNCSTHIGNSLAIITDGEQFCPMRFTTSNISVGILIAVDQHMGPGDHQLIVEAIKHGLTRQRSSLA